VENNITRISVAQPIYKVCYFSSELIIGPFLTSNLVDTGMVYVGGLLKVK
jgi:hypothetical protein